MPSTRRPLIARLRRRLATCAWLFAFLVLAKGVYAMACAADGVSTPVAVAASSGAETTAHAPSTADDANAPCWHDGSGDCHCACAHATALPPAVASLHAAIAPAVPAVFAAPRRAAPPPHSDLRPPIA